MLTIRREQMDALAESMAGQFADQMVQRVRLDSADRFHGVTGIEAGETRGDAVVRGWIATAASYGIEKENNIAIFIDWMLDHGPDFHLQEEHAWVKDILEFAAWSEDGKIGAIEHGLADVA